MRIPGGKSWAVILVLLMGGVGLFVLFQSSPENRPAAFAKIQPDSNSYTPAAELAGGTDAGREVVIPIPVDPVALSLALGSQALDSVDPGVLEVLAFSSNEELTGNAGVPLRGTEVKVLRQRAGEHLFEELFSVLTDSEGRFEVSLPSWSRNDILEFRPDGHCSAAWFCSGRAEAGLLNQGGRVTVTREFLPATEMTIELYGLPGRVETEGVLCFADVFRSADERRMYIAGTFEGTLEVDGGSASFRMVVPVGVKISLLVKGEVGLVFSHDTEPEGLMILEKGERRVLRIDLGKGCSIAGELVGIPDEFAPACVVVVEYVPMPQGPGAHSQSNSFPTQLRQRVFDRGGESRFEFVGLPYGSRRLWLEAPILGPRIPLQDATTGDPVWPECQDPTLTVEPSEPLIGFVWVDEQGMVVSDHRFSLACDEKSLISPVPWSGGIQIVPASRLRQAATVLLFSDRFGFRSIDVSGISLDSTQVVRIPAQVDPSAVGSLKVDIGGAPPEGLAVRLVRATSDRIRTVFWESGWEGGLIADVDSRGWVFPAVPMGRYELNLKWAVGELDVETADVVSVVIDAGRESELKLSVPSRPTSIHVRVSNWERAPRRGVNYDVFPLSSTGSPVGRRSSILIRHSSPPQTGAFDLFFFGSPPAQLGLEGPWMMEGAPSIPLQVDVASGEYFVELPFEGIESFDFLISSVENETLSVVRNQRSASGDALYGIRKLPVDTISGGVRAFFYAEDRPHGMIRDNGKLIGWFDLRNDSKEVMTELGGRELTISFSDPSGLAEVFALVPAFGAVPTPVGTVDTTRQTQLWIPTATQVLRFQSVGSETSTEVPIQGDVLEIQVGTESSLSDK